MATAQQQTEADEPTIKQQFAAAFGDIEPSHADRYDFSGCVVGEENITMWMPNRKTDPNGIELSEFEAVESVGMYYAPVSETETNDEVQRVYAARKDGKTHVVNADNVDTVAEMVDQSAFELIEAAGRMNADFANYPLVVELPEGKAMFAPIAAHDDELETAD